MNKKILLLLFFFRLYAGDPLEFWVGHSIQGKLSERVYSSLYQEFDYKNFMHEFYFYMAETSIDIECEKGFYVTPRLRFAFAKDATDNSAWMFEATPNLFLSYTTGIGKSSFTVTSNFMYRLKQFQHPREVVRISGTLSHPIKDRLKVHISEEVLYNYGGYNQIDENRVSTGFNVAINKNIALGCHYLRQYYKTSSRWIGANIFGVSISTKF